ncbi:MAG: hypothetical protein U0599_23865 [Vicinamibacteria bacterium]
MALPYEIQPQPAEELVPVAGHHLEDLDRLVAQELQADPLAGPAAAQGAIELAQGLHRAAVDAHEQVAALQARRLGRTAGHDARDLHAVLVRLRVEADPGVALGRGHRLAALEESPARGEQGGRDGQAVAADRGQAERDDPGHAAAVVEQRAAGEAGVDDRRHDRPVEHPLPERLERPDERDVPARPAPLVLGGRGEEEHGVARPQLDLGGERGRRERRDRRREEREAAVVIERQRLDGARGRRGP